MQPIRHVDTRSVLGTKILAFLTDVSVKIVGTDNMTETVEARPSKETFAIHDLYTTATSKTVNRPTAKTETTPSDEDGPAL